GGVRIDEPAVDLAVAVAVASNFKEVAVDPSTVVLGEVGLAGEVRSVSQTEKRLREAARLGFTRAVAPSRTAGKALQISGIKVVGAATLRDAVRAALGDGGS
ncbi:MAG: magnesium chelatase domain-containing protein, partial [Phycisphaerales bacterium]|nr:magnesium chelatase domain-containing protein [Phycisphaerales bacterium]